MRKLERVRVFNDGRKWSLMLPGRSFSFLGNQEDFKLFLRRIKASDSETQPKSKRKQPYATMVQNIVSGENTYIWLWKHILDAIPLVTRYDSDETGKRKNNESHGELITIKQDLQVPGTNIILEAGDVIEVFSAGTEYERIKEGRNNWPELSKKEWKSMTVDRIDQHLIRHDVDPNDVNDIYVNDKKTALMFASENNSDANVIQHLIDSGADINARDRFGKTALFFASFYSSRQVVQVLLKNRADVNAQDKLGMTALMWASGNKNEPKLMKFLIDRGAKVDVMDDEKMTPLNYAIHNKKDLEIIQLLIDKGADVNTIDVQRISVLRRAKSIGNNAVIQLLIDNGAIE